MTRACYLLDTTVLIDFSRGVKPVHERLHALAKDEHVLGVCGINITELYSGIAFGMNPDVDEFIDSLAYWEIDQEVFRTAGEYRYTFARQGITLASPDTIIAAVAHHHKATVLTGNLKHFPMTDITVERLGA